MSRLAVCLHTSQHYNLIEITHKLPYKFKHNAKYCKAWMWNFFFYIFNDWISIELYGGGSHIISCS